MTKESTKQHPMSPSCPVSNFPQRVTMELTNKCNLNCSFCPRIHMEKERGFMDVELAYAIIDEMAEHGVDTLVPFFRGESLLHPQWYNILEYACKKGVSNIQFTTNASLLSADYTEKLLDLELRFISLSLDTINPKLYNLHRRGADYAQTYNNVLRFIKRRNQRNSNIQIQVSAIETVEYKKDINKFVDHWLPKVERVRIYVEHSSDGNPGSIDEELPHFKTRLPCKKLCNDIVLYWNGETAICNHDWTRLVTGDSIGNIKDLGIEGVWHSDAYKSIRRAHKKCEFAGLSPCENCDHWKMYYMESGYLGRTYINREKVK